MSCLFHASRRVVAVGVGALGSALDTAAAAVLDVGEGVDALALAAGLRVLARLAAVAAVLEAVLGVDACALAARRAGASGREADGWRLLAVVERRRRREVDVGKEATSPEGKIRRRRHRHHRLLKGDEGKGERHEKDGGISHGGRAGGGGPAVRWRGCTVAAAVPIMMVLSEELKGMMKWGLVSSVDGGWRGGASDRSSAYTKGRQVCMHARSAAVCTACVIGAGAVPGAAARVRARTHAIAMVDLHGKSLECRAGVCGARLWWATAAI